MTNSVIGQAVKETRQKAHMTAAQLAEQIPADDRTIFRYEATGRITSDAMARIVQVLRSNELRESYCRECPVKNVRFKHQKKRPHRAWWSRCKLTL